MEVKFEKSQLRFLQTYPQQVQQQEQTLEVRLPDGMPDIGNVLGCWGQIVLRGKEWRGNSAGISGGVMAWVLYQPEEGGNVQSVKGWLPFQMKWDTESGQYDGTLVVAPLVRSADARCLSARKLMLRTNISVMARILQPEEMDVYATGEISADVCLLKREHTVCLPVEAGEKAFVLEESISLSGEDKVLCCSLKPEITEKKLMADKLIFRGVAILHMLCIGENGNLISKDYDLPFSQYAELDSIYEDAQLQVFPVVTELEQERGEDGSLQLKAGLSGQYIVYDCRTVLTVEDAYSPGRSLQLEQQTLILPSVQELSQDTVHGETSLQVDAAQIVDVSFWPEHPYLLLGDDSADLELSGTFQILYSDPDGTLQCVQTRWEDTENLPPMGHSSVNVLLQPTGKPRAGQDGAGLLLRADMLLEHHSSIASGIPMVTDIELGEPETSDPDRPSLILCRMGTESLWELAKRNGSTVEAIEKANSADKLSDPNRLIIIPIP